MKEPVVTNLLPSIEAGSESPSDLPESKLVIDKQAAANLWEYFEILRRWAEEARRNGKD